MCSIELSGGRTEVNVAVVCRLCAVLSELSGGRTEVNVAVVCRLCAVVSCWEVELK